MLKSTMRLALAAAVITVIGAAQAKAEVIAYTGTTTGGPTWNRPIAGAPPTVLSGIGTAVPYHVQPFYVNQTTTYAFQSASTLPPGWDNYTFLYQIAFNDATPLVNALIGNDDNPTVGLSGFSFALTAGTQYFFVTTGFDNPDFGDFTNTITGGGPGPGVIVLGSVPEPGPIALAGIAGLVGLVGRTAARRFRKTA